MATYLLDEVLLATLTGVVCEADDSEEIEEVANGAAGLAARLSAVCERHCDGADLPQGVSAARLAGAGAAIRSLGGFHSWRGAPALSGAPSSSRAKSRRPRRRSRAALHLISAYATEPRLVLAQREVDGKSNEITAIPELSDMLNLKGADHFDRRDRDQKEIARRWMSPLMKIAAESTKTIRPQPRRHSPRRPQYPQSRQHTRLAAAQAP